MWLHKTPRKGWREGGREGGKWGRGRKNRNKSKKMLSDKKWQGRRKMERKEGVGKKREKRMWGRSQWWVEKQFPSTGITKTPHSRHTQIFMTCRCMPLTSSTLIFSFALTSYNSMPIWSANLRASSVWTTFFSGQLFLVPTEVQDVCEGQGMYRHRRGVTYVQGQPVEKTHSYWVLSFSLLL